MARDIFQDNEALLSGSDDEGIDRRKAARRREKEDLVGSDGDSVDSGDDANFIVDDQGNPIKNRSRGKNRNDAIDDEQLREAHDIFGPDFDPNEFGEDDAVDSYTDDEEDEYGEPKPRVKR